jgi:hypothetical protein
MIVRQFIILGMLATLGVAPLAQAKEAGPPGQKLPDTYQAMLDCRAITDAAARLACFDLHVGALAQSQTSGEVVITDKTAIREARRGLFGFSLPSLNIFGSGDGKAKSEDLDRIETTVAQVRRSSTGGLKLVLAESGTWEQTDGRVLAFTPKAGSNILITKGAMGSYFVRIDGQPGIKMRRVD